MARLLLALVVLCVHAYGQDGVGPVIDQRLNDLRNIATPPTLPELPEDTSEIPEEWLGFVSWNIQIGGASTSADSPRPAMVGDALGRMFSGSYDLVAVQEVSNPGNEEVFRGLLPGTPEQWSTVFIDSNDRQDNLFAARNLPSSDSRLLLTTGVADESGRIMRDPDRALHPPVAAHFVAGDFDFTAISVHLTFADGDSEKTAQEMGHLLDFLDLYFSTPGHDPDVVISGDFNLPTRLSGQVGKGGVTLDDVLEEDPRFQDGERRLVAVVHEPTSRASLSNGGVPRNNYDHFILSADTLEEFIQARRIDPSILTDHPEDPEARLTSDHFPILALFRTEGPGVARDVGVGAPKITSVVHGATFEEGVTQGAWITIFGQELATSSRIWRPDEIVDGVLPTSLDGVRVRINGRDAAVYFVSPNQLNVQAPGDPMLGPVMVEILHDDEIIAAAATELREVHPGFFTFDPQGGRFVAAVHADGELVGPSDLFGGAVAARPAEPGDVILLFGTGFGPTDPQVPSGRVFTGAADLQNPVRVFFENVEAEVLFAGLSGAGLNQLNVVVPDGLPAGDVAIYAETVGARSPDGAFLRIGGAGAAPSGELVVISQVYGGGGNQGAELTNDFVEIFNRGSSTVDLTDWTIQYASASGSTWQQTFLSGQIPPGGYYLVQQGMGRSGGTTPLPNPDVVDEIPMSASSGKVALVTTPERLTGAMPGGASIADFVGYGSANFAEGSPAFGLDNTTAIQRAGGGCVDTDRNAQDFAEVAPAPRNSSSPQQPCGP